ncbi:MAG: VanZ family protein, partial [candidate division KSB1 bacterium]
MPRPANLPLQLLLLYAVFIIYATIVPFAFDTPPESFSTKLETLLADPLQLQTSRGFSLTDVVSNVLLLLPFGMLLARARLQSRPSAKRMHVVLLATCVGLLLSGLVEFIQFFSERRVASLLDCWANAAGAMLGAGGAKYYRERRLTYWQRLLRPRFAQAPELRLFGLYAAVLVFAQLMPLHPTLDFSTIKKTAKAADFTLPQTPAALGDLFGETILYAGFAFLWLRTQKQAQQTRSIMQAILLTAGLALLLECGQLFLVAHVVRLRNLLAGLEGGLYGAVCFILLQMRVARQPRASRSLCERKLMLNLGLGHLLAYIFLLELKPYEFDFSAATFAEFEWLPFIEYYRNTNAHAVA